ncbi:ABC-2 type transport system permease protein [Amycolatopsis lexingtonensis]|uniref:ABC-2 type transport system permease protein n=1 Tax=Amycolatopsis lexingtonensis TaxID=218822 RepID=A0ABR9HT15_9PSEU|nr:ABC transporter permease subunit [Amycolatopsis lexingtonensis]MBE1494066.1 ABC-2 type transport system permease protein [Amycolatopsis lexingtonensis]
MLRDILLKTLHDQRRGLLAWSVSLVLLVAMYVALWPSIRDQPSMGQFLQNIPEAMRALFAASGADMSTPTGYVQVELLSFMGPMLLLIYAITTGAAGVAGEEDRHTLELLMANPVSRTRVVLEKLAALVVGTVLLGLVTGLALVLEGRLAGLTLPIGHVAAAMLHMTLLALVFGALAAAIGGLTGHGTASRAIPAVVAVVAYVLNGLGPIVSWLRPAQKISPFYQYIGHDPLRTGVSLAAVLVAVLTTAVLAAVTVAGFRRRDLAA